MPKQRKSLSTKKPPVPTVDHKIIETWICRETMPAMQPFVQEIDNLILQHIPQAHFSIKWGNAFYGTPELGWLIEVAAFAKSVNIVFLSGAKFSPQPPLGEDSDTRYIKITSLEEIKTQQITDWIIQTGKIKGWD